MSKNTSVLVFLLAVVGCPFQLASQSGPQIEAGMVSSDEAFQRMVEFADDELRGNEVEAFEDVADAMALADAIGHLTVTLWDVWNRSLSAELVAGDLTYYQYHERWLAGFRTVARGLLDAGLPASAEDLLSAPYMPFAGTNLEIDRLLDHASIVQQAPLREDFSQRGKDEQLRRLLGLITAHPEFLREPSFAKKRSQHRCLVDLARLHVKAGNLVEARLQFEEYFTIGLDLGVFQQRTLLEEFDEYLKIALFLGIAPLDIRADLEQILVAMDQPGSGFFDGASLVDAEIWEYQRVMEVKIRENYAAAPDLLPDVSP